MQGGIDWWYREASLNKFEKYYVYHKRYTFVESFGSFTEAREEAIVEAAIASTDLCHR